MKSFIKVISLTIILIGIMSVFVLPIYLMISTSFLKDILPSWFVVVNFVIACSVLATLMISFLYYLLGGKED